jgi:hypothetical protein
MHLRVCENGYPKVDNTAINFIPAATDSANP